MAFEKPFVTQRLHMTGEAGKVTLAGAAFEAVEYFEENGGTLPLEETEEAVGAFLTMLVDADQITLTEDLAAAVTAFLAVDV